MRLIDADELKKAFKNQECWNVVIAHIIDNAPTVEPCYQTTSCLDCKNYDKENHNCPRYCEVIKEAIKSRPQGEWIYRRIITKDRSFDMVVCSNCQTEFSWDAETGVSMDNYKTCPNCSADMRGEKK